MYYHLISINTLSELRAQEGSIENAILTLGQSLKGDSKGAFYYFDPSDNATPEDTTYYNTVVPNTGIGRWKKVFTRMVTLPHGVLVINSGKREFFCSTTINSNSEATINLTMDNTVNGTPIFTGIWFDDSKAIPASITNANDAVSSCRKSVTENLKQLTHYFYRGNNANAGVVSLNVMVSGLRNATAGTPVNFKVEGV